MGRSIRERCGPQKLKLVVFQEQFVEWFEIRCRRSEIRDLTFVECTFGKPRPKSIKQYHPVRLFLAHI